MSEHKNAENGKTQVGAAPITRSRRTAPRLLAALFAAGIATASMMVFAHGAGDNDAHNGAGTHGGGYEQMDVAHLRVLVHHLMSEASPDQKSKFIAIAHSAEQELVAMEKLASEAHRQKVELLLQDKLDRGALEQARRDEMQAANELSTRIDRVLADLAQVMTPEQRTQMREHARARQAGSES
jgi:Spy/CpxP family protein refolding chaperone